VQAKPEPTKPEKAKPTESAKSEPKTAAKAPTKSTSVPARPAAGGELWVQVGAFRDAATAKKVADGLKAKGFDVAQSTLTRGGGASAAAGTENMPSGPADKYDVVVAGAAADISRKLSDKGLSAETVRDGAVVRPSLPLRDAVTLSNDLRGEGFAVSVRRVATGGAAPAPVASGGETLHRVRVGAFADRTAANAAIEKLRALGYTPFVARGRE
jgi:cell division septation protein DedD